MDTALREEMRLERERIYPHPELRGLYTKTSVSELKHAAYDEEEAKRVFETEQREAYIPSFAEEKEKSSGTARGSAYHRVLELLPYERMPEDAKERRQWLERCREKMRAEGRLSGEYDALIRLPAMERFLMQEIAGRMSEAAKRGDLFREQPFFMGVPAKELGETFPDHEHVIIQGVIDVYLAEPDGLVLLDYKTDRVTNAEELITRYRTQLDLYARALEQIRGIAVKEILIYSFALDRTIALERIGNSTERQQACCLGES